MRYACLLTLAITAPGHAEDPFACVDPDVVNAFLGSSYHGDVAYSTSIPSGFGSLEIPAGFSLIGSQSSDTVNTVIYKSTAGAEPSLQVAVDAMAKSGWQDKSKRQQRSMGGFQAYSMPLAATLCHEQDPYAIAVNATVKADTTFVSYTRFEASQGCEAEEAPSPRHRPESMMARIPTLDLPDGVRATNHGISGSGDEVSSQVDISSTLTVSELMSHFERQIQAQGWEFQTTWASRQSSGSVWILNTDEDGPLIGTLHVIDPGGQPVRIRFSVIPASPTRLSNSGTWSRRSG